MDLKRDEEKLIVMNEKLRLKLLKTFLEGQITN